jgi:hypothetical protein
VWKSACGEDQKGSQGIFQLTLDGMRWRFKTEKNRFLFGDTMLKLIHSDNFENKDLRKAA